MEGAVEAASVSPVGVEGGVEVEVEEVAAVWVLQPKNILITHQQWHLWWRRRDLLFRNAYSPSGQRRLRRCLPR